jgi:hypothetical protein
MAQLLNHNTADARVLSWLEANEAICPIGPHARSW